MISGDVHDEQCLSLSRVSSSHSREDVSKVETKENRRDAQKAWTRRVFRLSLLFFPRARRAFESDLAPCFGSVKKEEKKCTREREREREREEGKKERQNREPSRESERVQTRPSCRCTLLDAEKSRRKRKERKKEKDKVHIYTPGVYDIPGISELTIDTLAKKLKKQSNLMFICIKVDKFLSRFNLLFVFL